MPPKERIEEFVQGVDSESTNKSKKILVPQVFNLDNLNPALLPELATFNEIQLKVVEENPFVAIVDTASRELAKKHRTARVSARTALQNQDKLISSKFNEAKTKAKSYIAELIAITKPGEDEQQSEIDRDEAVLEAKRQEKARLEKERIDNIKAELDKYAAEWKDAFNLMTFQTIENIGANFLESYTTFDTTILQEFESLFPTKVEELTKILSDKTVSLTDAEKAKSKEAIGNWFISWGSKLNYMVFENSTETVKLFHEQAKLTFSIPEFQEDYDSKFKEIESQLLTKQGFLAKTKADSDKLAKEKAELEAKKKLADIAEAKAKKEKEDFEKEKADFAKQQEEANKKSAYQLKVDARIDKLIELGLKFDFQSTFVGFDFFIDVLDIKTYDEEKWEALIEKIEEKKLTPLPETQKEENESIVMVDGYSTSETPIAEKVEIPEILVPENTTANVYSHLSNEEVLKITEEHRKEINEIGSQAIINGFNNVENTWDSIAEDFKNSGGKSYSLWLKNNYNVPTKIQA